MMHGLERKGASRRDRLIAALRRAGYLGLLAFAFRFQLFTFGYPHSAAADLLKVDILNCMSVAIVTVGRLASPGPENVFTPELLSALLSPLSRL